MPAKYTLRYLPIAQDDLLAIYDYIAQDSSVRALAFVDKLDERIGRLSIIPFWAAYLVTLDCASTDIVS